MYGIKGDFAGTAQKIRIIHAGFRTTHKDSYNPGLTVFQMIANHDYAYFVLHLQSLPPWHGPAIIVDIEVLCLGCIIK